MMIKQIPKSKQTKKSRNYINILILLLIIFCCNSINIDWISTVADSATSPMAGSLNGGTAIHIKATGISPDPTLSKVLLKQQGSTIEYPCNIPGDGVVAGALTCITTSSPNLKQVYNLVVNIYSIDDNGISNFASFPSTVFSYQTLYTPIIYDVFPAVAIGNTKLNYYGYHRISNLGDQLRDTGDIIEINIGDQICNVFDLPQADINPNAPSIINCVSSYLQEAGKYLVSQHLTPGYSGSYFSLQRTSFKQQNYNFVVLPNITSITPQKGGVGGEIITIIGSGFSVNVTENIVTIDGTPCIAKNSSSTEIKCVLKSKQINQSSLLSTNTTVTQNNGYQSGSGFFYTRYDINSISPQSPSKLKQTIDAGLTLPIFQKGFRGQIKTKSAYESLYGQVYKGYFTAPVDGNYIFRGISKDQFTIYLNLDYGTTSNSPTVNMSNLIAFSNYPQNMDDIYITDYTSAESNPILLKAEKKYYMEVYHVGKADGALSISVEVPNTNKQLSWQTHETQFLQTDLTNDPQVLRYNLTGVSSGTILLQRIQINSTYDITYQKNASINYNATGIQFCNALNQFYFYSGYGLTCSRLMYDSANIITTDYQNATTFSWLVTIQKYRALTVTAIKFNSNLLNGSIQTNLLTSPQTLNPHSPLLSGTFSASIGGVSLKIGNSTDIPYDVQASVLQQSLRSITQVDFTKVLVYRKGTPNLGAKWIISFIGANFDIPQIIFVNNLVGGKIGTFPTINSTTRRNYSSNLLFNPIDYQFMSTYSSQPNVIVQVNGINSVCLNNCTYQFITNVPQITSIDLSSNILTITLSDPNSVNISLANIEVRFDDEDCINLNGQMISFTCNLPLNTDGITPLLAAGYYFPIVYINTIGFIEPMSNVSAIHVPLIITSVSPNQTTNNGGNNIVIQGSGFVTNTSQSTVTINGIQSQILSISNTEITVVSPITTQNTSSTIQINSRTLGASSSINITTPSTYAQIFSISPISASPVLKGIMNITGTGFGTDQLLVKVYLANSTGNIYQMRILKINDTFMQCGIPGGLPGNFIVVITVSGLGNAIPNPSNANSFVYESVITNVSPVTGSAYGGTLLTISGRNFVADKMQSLVFIGNQLNQFCYIETISSSTITCRTIYNSYYSPNTAQVITLTSRLIIDNTCEGSCQFSYIQQNLSPHLTSISPSSITTGNVILTGQRFDIGTCMVSLLNNLTSQITVVVPNSCNSTSINFTLPNSIEAGFYYVTSQNDPIGKSNPMILQVNMYLASPISSTISINGGKINFAGNGLPAVWPNQHYRSLTLTSNGKNLPLKIISTSTTSLILQVPAGVSGTSYIFKIISPTMNSYTKAFSQQVTSTPTVSLISSNSGTSGSFSVNLNRTNLITTQPQIIEIFSVNNPQFVINALSWTYSGSIINFNVLLNSGKYGFKLYDDIYGWYTCSGYITVTNSGSYSIQNISTSFNGGVFTVTGANISQAATISVEGRVGKFLQGDTTSASFAVPQLITPLTQSSFNLVTPTKLDLNKYFLWGDTKNWQSSFDSQEDTFYQSNNSICSIGVHISPSLGVSLTRIRYFPYTGWNIASNYLQGAQFQVSNDNSSWTTISIIDTLVHAGWNIIMVNNQNPYKYIRFYHNSTSKCMLSQFQLSGIIMNMVTVSSISSHFSDVIFNDGSFTQTWAGAIQYRQNKTAIVNTVSPKNGNVFGNYTLTLTGLYLNSSTPSINIDGQQCILISNTQSQIVCNVSSRLTLPEKNTFDVNIGGIPSILKDNFRYVMRWSDVRTWGTDLPPIDDDLVYVPAGMHLLVDQSTPLLNGIIVQGGTLQFSDQTDMIIRAGYITLIEGAFIAGTQNSPYMNKLTFIMYGNYYGMHQPMFGNKGIGCMNCKFSMYGQKRTPTWTLLQTTVNPNENQLNVTDTVDWRVGQQIVIASTSYDHNEAERFKIASITGKRITIDGVFKYQHYSDVQNYGTDTLTMRAEVGLLTRNIKMMGDDSSIATDYGSHLMLTGSAQNGFVGHVGYTQFTRCGQPQIVGRYCIHFHMAGDVSESFAIGNAVHDSMARVITIHGVHFLYVAWNVGYRVKGHNFFIQDGIQTNNIIQHNLAIGSLSVFNMMQTDISVASFWITNPYNHFRYNHAAGSDFYGIWYQIKPHPDGPSATLDICPIGNILGQVHDNVAHSNVRFGLRIKQLQSRKNPCQPIRNNNLNDPWSQNPSIQSKFSNFTLYKNKQAGLLAQQTGHTIFQNFTIAESLLAGMQFYRNNQTKQYVRVINSAIIGKSFGNGPSSESSLSGSKGAIGPRSGTLSMQNVSFYQFPSVMTVFQSCSKCNEVKLYTNTGQQYFFSGIKFNNINGSYLFMKGLKRQILYDLDGTFTKNFDSNSRNSATLTWNWKHIAAQSSCLQAQSPSLWDNALVCDDTITIRKVMFTNLFKPSEFLSIPMKAQLINSPNQEVNINTTTLNSQIYSLQQNMEPKIQNKFSFSLPYVTNRTYNIWWKSGIDFTHLSMQNSPLYSPADQGILFKFKYIQNRQLFQIATLKDIQSSSSAAPVTYNTKNVNYPDPNTCTNGQYYHNNDVNASMMVLCSSGKSKVSPFQYIDVNGIKCRYLCPKPPGQFVKQNFMRLWSNATQWPNNRMPLDGQNVTVNGNWTIVMDVNPAIAPLLTIDGDVILIDDRNINITAQSIWIRAGSVTAGSASQPFTHKLTIQINGQKQDRGIVIDPFQAGNKLFAITGTLNLYGKTPSSLWTKLTSYARVGDTSITVQSASGWAIGDQIILSPSFSDSKQKQKVTITAISSNTITFSPALKYDHFGSSSATVTTSFGVLDTRAGVGHLTRNIKIVSGPNYTWGYRMLVYGYKDTNGFMRTGDVILSGVQFTMGGQFDTQKSTLDINNIRAGATQSLITKSSFHQCKSFCMNIDNVALFNINNNVFYDAKLFHVRALNLFSFSFTNNLMTGVSKRQQVPFNEMVACFASYEQFDVQNQNVSISNNLCQGSTGIGFAITFVQCSLIDFYPFIKNIVGSAQIGYLINGVSGNCQAAKNLIAYASKIGQLCNPVATELRLSNFIMADNERSVTIRVGGNSDLKAAYFNDSYITALSRPSCFDCYGVGKIKCNENHAMRMMAIGSNSQSMPAKFTTGFDVICKQQSFDGKAFLYNNVFDNFKQTYSGLPQCSNNVVFKPHGGSVDITGSHHLWNTTCINCDANSYGYFPPPLKSQLGWFGGCGTILCTGMNNYLIQDHTGDFFTFKGTILANNSWIGQNTANCSKNLIMNGYVCQREDFGVLQYQSLAPDFNTRIMWPVYLKYQGGTWTSQTNGWKQWHWEGGEPLNNRIGRFVSIVQLQQNYNVTMAAMPPIDMRYRIQRRLPSGNSSDWVVIKMYYPMPNSISVSVKGNVIKPISLLDNNGQNQLDKTVCGSNKFFYKNYTIHFVVTGDADCEVRVQLTNSIQLTSRFSMDINDFFSNNGQTLFIDRMCALLQINDTSRLKIVGVYNGSVTVISFIEAPKISSTDGSALTQSQQMASIQATQNLLNQVVADGSLNSALSTGGSLGPLLSVSSTVHLLTGDNENKKQIDQTGMIIGVVLGVTIVICLVVIITICYIRKRAKISQLGNNELPMDSQGQKGNQMNNNNKVISDQNFSITSFESKKQKEQLN